MLYLISLILVLIENNLPIDGILVCVSLSFITYLINFRKSLFFMLIIYFFMASQTDKYFTILMILFIYTIISSYLSSHIEYNKKSMLYYVPLQLIIYYSLSYKFFTIEYFIFNFVGLVLFNYIYIKYSEIKENK
ncbi:MAG: hypothetical protein KGV57_04925 [Fusobacterium sp.]|nr:hypothetical protein [Fusobacterium sp.]